MSNRSDELLQGSTAQGGRAPNTARRWMIPAAMLVSTLALAGCGPDTSANGPSASTGVAATSATPAAESAATAGSAPSIVAPACPKAVTPKCPAAAPAARATAMASLAAPNLASPNPASTDRWSAHEARAWSAHARRAWRHAHSHHHGGGYAGRERREYDGEGLTRGDRLANERDRHEGLLGGRDGWREGRDFAGSDRSFHGGYRIVQEDSRAFTSSHASGFGSDERIIELHRQEGHEAFGPCPVDCRGQAYRRFSYAGVDGRGYLVWPGKVEY